MLRRGSYQSSGMSSSLSQPSFLQLPSDRRSLQRGFTASPLHSAVDTALTSHGFIPLETLSPLLIFKNCTGDCLADAAVAAPLAPSSAAASRPTLPPPPRTSTPLAASRWPSAAETTGVMGAAGRGAHDAVAAAPAIDTLPIKETASTPVAVAYKPHGSIPLESVAVLDSDVETER
jgi:hypothetical protein